MNWANPLFIIPIATGPVFILGGILMLKFPPKNINNIYGYRTRRSMQSQESWDYAQRYSSRKMILAGVTMTLFSIAGLFIQITELWNIIAGLLLVLVTAAVPIVLTEKELRSKFSQNNV